MPSVRAHPNPRAERHEGAKNLRNAILRLVRDMEIRTQGGPGLGNDWKACLVSQDLGVLTPSPDSLPYLSVPRPSLSKPLGIEWLLLSWCPGVIVPKLLCPVPSPQRLVRVGMRDGEGLGLWEQVGGLICGLSDSQLRPRCGMSRSLLSIWVRKTDCDPEEGKIEKERKDVGKGGERQDRRKEVEEEVIGIGRR